MKNALQIYGELRTFVECVPTILKFINFENIDYDVFLFIDDKGKSKNNNFNEENCKKLFEMLKHENLKVVKLVSEMSNEEISHEDCLYNKYISSFSDFTKKYPQFIKNEFVPRLMYRKFLLNKYRIEYERSNNITYDFIIRTHFDIKNNSNNVISFEKTPIMCSDVLTIASPDFTNKEMETGLHMPFSAQRLFTPNLELRKDMYEKYKNWKGDKFWQYNWVFMPELNYRLYLLEHNISFIEAWWLEPRNLGFSILR